MTLMKVFVFLLFSQYSTQQTIVVTKKSGEELSFTSIDFFQGNKRSDVQAITYWEDDKTRSLPISELKRINLKKVSSKKGITNWNAILVKLDNQKLEVILPLDRIYGIDGTGNEIKISSSSIDKISF